MKPFHIDLTKNATLLGGAWTDHDEYDSFVEARVPASFSGGVPATSFGVGQVGNENIPIKEQRVFVYPGETLVISGSSAANAELDAHLHWGEYP